MFVYLSKKIAIPNGVKLRTVAWNNDQGWIVCGGEEGLLKVLKLESSNPTVGGTNAANAESPGGALRKDGEGTSTTDVNAMSFNTSHPPTSAAMMSPNAQAQQQTQAPFSTAAVTSAAAAAASTNLSMNQTLEGHSGAVVVSTWNQQHRKLTTSDQYGLIIVWTLYRGMWYEEMINNRNRSVVADMQWNKDGQKICIVYEDGAIIVGSVDGNRIWGKELKQTLSHVQWAPDSRMILFANKSGELMLYDSHGNFISKIQTRVSEAGANLAISAMDWYNGLNGYIDTSVPCLAICYENGRVEMMRIEEVQNSIIIDTGMRSLNMKWNHCGSILAVSGIQSAKSSQGEDREVSVVQFYTPYGQHVRSLKIPGKKVSSLSWEYGGLRIALAVDSFIYFANIRPDYKWTYFAGDTLGYAFHRPDRTETCLVFWNTKTNDKFLKLVTKLSILEAYGDYCLVATKQEEGSAGAEAPFLLSVCNAIGTAMESKPFSVEPKFGSINQNYVIVATNDIVLCWQYKQTLSSKMAIFEDMRKKDNRERMFHIDDVMALTADMTSFKLGESDMKRVSNDPIVALTSSDSQILLARASGVLVQISLPALIVQNQYATHLRAQSVSINCDHTRIAIIDISGMMKVMEIEAAAKTVVQAKFLDIERKDIWDMKWAKDAPDLFVMMEKAKMYIFRDTEPEDPVVSYGYICDFDNLQIKTVLLDDIMRDPDTTNKDQMVTLEAKTLRECRSILNQSGLSDCFTFVENNPHPRLWRFVADAALGALDFEIARKAFIHCSDYQGIQFVKKLEKLDDKVKRKAEVACYFSMFEVAEKIYLDMDRKDLAIDMRIKLGDWFRVVQLIKSGGGADDVLMERSWNCIGDYYFERHRWAQALTYYMSGRNLPKLAECYYALEDYEGLEKLIYALPEKDSFLKNIAEKFVTVGLCKQAVAGFLKLGDVQAAVDTCIYLNQWNTAVELAEKYKFTEIEGVFSKYASYLLDKNKRFEAIELYRKANYYQKAAKLLFELAQDSAKKGDNPLRVKKLYVLAALEVERHHAVSSPLNKEEAAGALEGILAEETKNIAESSTFMDKAWRGAEAYHFLLLAHRHYYSGDVEASLKTALQLQNYEDLIDPKIIYSFLAFVSLRCQYYATCSKAFIKLESLPFISDEDRKEYEDIALTIFSRYPPLDPKGHHVSCTNCGSLLKNSDSHCISCRIDFPICIVSGRPIFDYHHFACPTCKHRAIEHEISSLMCCPLVKEIPSL